MTSATVDVSRILRELRFTCRPPRDRSEVASQLARLPAQLPAVHQAVFDHAGGVTAYGGYFRLFSAAELVHWNEIDTWKFAWPAAAREYLCFAESGWGDQYAYRLDDLAKSRPGPVFILDALRLEPEEVAADFLEFLTGEFSENAVEPYDTTLIAARERFGELGEGLHLVHAPSPLITGKECLDDVVKMKAEHAMVVAGDVASQLLGPGAPRTVRGIEPYQDEKGRTRIRLVS